MDFEHTKRDALTRDLCRLAHRRGAAARTSAWPSSAATAGA
ncbi:hypothetical protein ACU686_20940 [Yinghuangia aomiensis]